MEYYYIFEVPFGLCGVAWSVNGVTRFQLPERETQTLEARMRMNARQEWRDELPKEAAYAVTKLRRYFEGERVDFSDLPLDLGACNSFGRAVYEATRSVGWGEAVTYGELARKMGSPGAARAVGGALSRNPIAIIVPCHRVLAAGAKIGGFSAHGGIALKERLLELEGARLAVQAAVDRPSASRSIKAAAAAGL